MRSEMLDVDGLPVHVADYGGSGPAMVLVHGLGGSHVNWVAVAPRLAEHYRVLVPDLAGFGLTPPLGRSASVGANARLLEGLLARLGEPAVLVGNSMGGLVSMLAAAHAPGSVRALVLVDSSLPTPLTRRPNLVVLASFAAYSVPRLGEAYVRRRAARLGPERMVDETMKLCTVDPARIPRDALEAQYEMARRRRAFPYSLDAYLEAARSIVRTLAQRRRFTALMRSMAMPVLMVHGDHDRLVDVAAARAALRTCPSWQLEVYEGYGHIPMLEAPDRLVESVLRFGDEVLGAGAAA